MPPLKDGVLRTIANHKANMTDEEVAEAQRGNVIDIAVATGGIAYVRINSEGKEKHSPTNILYDKDKRNERLRELVANVSNISAIACVDALQRLQDNLNSRFFVSASGKTYPSAKVENCRRVLLLEPEERRQVMSSKMQKGVGSVFQGSMLPYSVGMHDTNMPMQTQTSISSNDGSYNLNWLESAPVNWSHAFPMMAVAQGYPTMQQSDTPLSPVSAQLASFERMPQVNFTAPFGYYG